MAIVDRHDLGAQGQMQVANIAGRRGLDQSALGPPHMRPNDIEASKPLPAPRSHLRQAPRS